MTQTNPIYLSDDDRAMWQADVDDCPACQAHDDETVCADHDLDDEAVALRYAGSGDDKVTTCEYTIYDADPDVSSGGELHTDTVEADTVEDAIDDVRSALEVYAAGLSREQGYAPGDRLYALVRHAGGTERVAYTLTADDLA